MLNIRGLSYAPMRHKCTWGLTWENKHAFTYGEALARFGTCRKRETRVFHASAILCIHCHYFYFFIFLYLYILTSSQGCCHQHPTLVGYIQVGPKPRSSQVDSLIDRVRLTDFIFANSGPLDPKDPIRANRGLSELVGVDQPRQTISIRSGLWSRFSSVHGTDQVIYSFTTRRSIWSDFESGQRNS